MNTEKIIRETEKWLKNILGDEYIILLSRNTQDSRSCENDTLIPLAKQVVSQRTGVAENVILSRIRKTEVVEARHILVYLLYNHNYKPSKIARVLGVDRSGTYNSILFVESQMEVDREFNKLVHNCVNDFKNKFANVE